jgi:hypothetical protein
LELCGIVSDDDASPVTTRINECFDSNVRRNYCEYYSTNTVVNRIIAKQEGVKARRYQLVMY